MKAVTSFTRNHRLVVFLLLSLAICVLLSLSGLARLGRGLIIVVSVVGLVPIIIRAYQDNRAGVSGSAPLLLVISVVTAIVLHQPWLAVAALLIYVCFSDLARYLERRIVNASPLLKHTLPQSVSVLRGRKTVSVATAKLEIGDKFLVESNSIVPADAEIIDGASSFDEALVTGQSQLQPRLVGEHLLAGSRNDGPTVTAKVVATSDGSSVQSFRKLLRSSLHGQTPFARLAARYSLPFTVMVIAVGSAAWVLSGQSERFLAVLLAASALPLVAVPQLVLRAGLLRASRMGIFYRSATVFQDVSEAETVAFASGGVITSRTPKVTEISTFAGASQSDVLSLAASLEQQSDHRFATAILQAAELQKIKLGKARHVQTIAGEGLLGQHKGKQIIVGRLQLIEQHGVTLPAKIPKPKANASAVFVANGEQLIGIIWVQQELRQDSSVTVASLRALGIKNQLLFTSDADYVADARAAAIGVATVHADITAATRLNILEAIERRPVLYVGDGRHNTVAFSGGEVSLALFAAQSSDAGGVASVLVASDEFGHVAHAATIAHRSFKIARRSVVVSMLLSFIAIGLTASSILPLAASLAAQFVVCAIAFVVASLPGNKKLS